MHRRQYLRAALVSTAVLSGCLSTADPEPSQSPDPSPPEDAYRKVSIGERDPVPDSAAVRPSVSVEDPWVTHDSTAVLLASIQNVGEEVYEIGPLYYRGTSDDHGPPGLLLYAPQAGTAPPVDYVPPCFPETPDREYVGTRVDPDGEEWVHFGFERHGHLPVHPHVARTDRLLVVDDPTHDGCLPPGEYTFESLHPSESDPEWGAGSAWEFTVVVEEV